MIITLSKNGQGAIALGLLVAPFVLWRVVLNYAARDDSREIRSLIRWIGLLGGIAMIAAFVLFFVNSLQLLSIGLGGFSVGLLISLNYLKQQLQSLPPTA